MFTALRTGTAIATLLLLVSGAAAPPATACGFDGVFDGNFSALHSKSFAAAFAIKVPVDAGIVEMFAVDPIVPGSVGYGRAVEHFNDFQRRLSAAAGQSRPVPSVAVLFIDSNLWPRLTPAAQGFDTDVHTDGDEPDEVVVVTSEAN